MIQVIINNLVFNEGLEFQEGESITIEIHGHSLYNNKGKDIVCAAVSAISQTVLLSITQLGQIPQKIDQRDGYLKTEIKISVLDDDKKNILKILLNTFIIGIFEIKKNYSEFIDIKFKADKNSED